MDDLISISTLNDFIFCPYSIYLHNVYMGTDESLYHAVPQTRGRIVHERIDNKTYSTRKDDITSLPVYSEKLGIVGTIDLFRRDKKLLIERKYRLKQIFRGHYYQLWAQYFCMIEMGYAIEHLAFYELSTNRMIPVDLPKVQDYQELSDFIERFRQYRPEVDIVTNINKCMHCIYCNLCDKNSIDNVYT